MEINKILEGMLATRDCLGLQEHKVLTLNTCYNYPIEEPKTTEMKRLKDFGMSCFREGWIHAVSVIMDLIKENSQTKTKKVIAVAEGFEAPKGNFHVTKVEETP